MPNAFYFLVCTLIWGSTWLAINFQIGHALAPTYAVGIRFLLAAIILGLFCFFTRKNMCFTRRQHGQFLLVGVFFYALDYGFLYAAQHHIVSALLALMSSSVIYFNVVLRRVFLGKPVNVEVVVGATLGLIGIACIFLPELQKVSMTAALSMGVLLATCSFLSAAVGNVVSENTLADVPVVQMNFYTMLYGSGLVLGGMLVLGQPIIWPTSPSFYIALVYLALFGSVIAFGCYMTLIQNIGSDKAAYVVLLYPLVALVLSTFFENYQWSLLAGIGVVLVLLGNACAMGKIPLLHNTPAHDRIT
ncbi:MAG: EamA family transporter [Glaciecola sp.]|jgi:drug/metabolite transporter (DMT)-like permease